MDFNFERNSYSEVSERIIRFLSCVMTETSTVFEREEARKVGGRGSVPISTQGADGDRLFMFKVIGIDLLERVSDFFPSPGLVPDHKS